MSNDSDINPEAAALRGKRTRRPTQAEPQPGGTTLSAHLLVPATPPATVAEAMGRRSFLLFDPAELPPVVEIGGHVPSAELDDRYIVSEFDASETIVPAGCTTGVSRLLWQRGQHVRRDIYAQYVNTHHPGPAA